MSSSSSIPTPVAIRPVGTTIKPIAAPPVGGTKIPIAAPPTNINRTQNITAVRPSVYPVAPVAPVAPAPVVRSVGSRPLVTPGAPVAPVAPTAPIAPLGTAISVARPVAPVAPTVATKALTPGPIGNVIAAPTTVAAPGIRYQPSASVPTGTGIMSALARGRITTAPTALAVQATPAAAPNIVIEKETEEKLLRSFSNIWPATELQLRQLLDARYQDGTNIISLKRRDIIMEIIGMIVSSDFESVLNFITNAPDPDYILWEQPGMDEGRIKLNREIAVQQLEESGVKDIGKCLYCASKELVFSMKQIRSGDEPMTVFIRCVLCGKQWRQ